MKKINWKYAFGEILIVIIGITIAFSLNKCSESSKNQKIKTTYLQNLINDIKKDQQALEKNLITLEEYRKNALSIPPLLKESQEKKMSAIEKVFKISPLIEFVPQDITYKTLINSGDLKLFDDIALKSAIQKYYSSNLHEVLKAYKRQEIIHTEYLGKYYIYNSDFERMAANEFPFEDERLLKRIVQSLGGAYSIQIKASKKGITQCDSIIAVLNKEIQKK